MHLKVNRYLNDEAMDHIDHALGRPVDPLGETYREYFAACRSEADDFRCSPHWEEGKNTPDLVWFYVTRAGREALARHLKEIGDAHRAFIVSWGGFNMPIAAKSHGKARYKKWIEVSDAVDVSFKDFQATARVRLA